ncbi:hypothetical protein IT881_08775 [Erythrobacter sp. A30-3]|nr:hypothetical protein IT881_08775 [Erythrobacter sp. A30-3]
MTYNFKKKAPRKDTIEHTVYHPDGDEIGTFTIKYHLQSDPRWTKRLLDMKKLLKPADVRRLENPKTEEDILFTRQQSMNAFVDHVIVDSKLLGEGDEVIPHSAEMLKEYFADPENFWVFSEIDQTSAEVANFRIEQAEEAKND